MKTTLLFLGALLTPALACETRDGSVERPAPAVRTQAVASAQSGKSTPSKQLPAPSAPSSPATKPGDKERAPRPARPAYLFL